MLETGAWVWYDTQSFFQLLDLAGSFAAYGVGLIIVLSIRCLSVLILHQSLPRDTSPPLESPPEDPYSFWICDDLVLTSRRVMKQNGPLHNQPHTNKYAP